MFHESMGMGGEMLKVALAVTGLAVGLSVAVAVGSKFASGKGDAPFVSATTVSPHEIMLHFDMTKPADEIRDYI
jgi:hypothetical protein